jgi:nucleoside-diphosphate-sugar epimerase
MNKSVLITGGAGFIGSNIARVLLQKKYGVTIIDNLSTGRLENISDIRKKLRFVRGDIRNLNLLQKVMKGTDYVLHQAALPSVPRSINNPLASHDVNVNGTFNVLLAARDQKVKKVVLASSSSIYGNRKTFGTKKLVKKGEIMKPMPLSPYAVNKLIGEEYAKVFAHIFNVPTVCLRYFNVFGPHQDPKSEYAAVIPKFITTFMRGGQPTIYGDGLQSRDFTYIDNVVNANILAMLSKHAIHGETLNIACGESITLLHVTRAIAKTLKRKMKPKFGPVRTGDVKTSLANISKAKKYIGYAPHIKFDKGLKRTIDWYRKVKKG